jgi:uncharacterized protein HemX
MPKISSSLQENDMSGAMTVLAVAAVASTAYTVYSGEQAREQQGKALDQQRQAQSEAKTAAEKQQATAEQNVNRANAKSPDAGAILSAAGQAAKGGASGTMLTGPSGVNQADLNLGKSTLLGG